MFLPRLSMLCVLLSLAASMTLSPAYGQQELNPAVFYFVNGETIGNRGFQVGDSENWSVPVTNLEGETETGALKVKPVDYQGEDDALQATWKGGTFASLALYGPAYDLTQLENLAALAIEIKADRVPREGSVNLALDCGYPCRKELAVRDKLAALPRGKWDILAVPLNCFTLNGSGDEFDISKVSGPFVLSTEEKLKVAVANIRLILLPEGEKGCAAE